jgi:hypothetical protein
MLKLWVSGIVAADVADSFQALRNALEHQVNTTIQQGHYGAGLGTWDLIIAVRPSPPAEYVRYNRRTKETDVRLTIDHAHFLRASTSERATLIAATLRTSLHKLAAKGIPEVDSDRLQQDVSGALANANGLSESAEGEHPC